MKRRLTIRSVSRRPGARFTLVELLISIVILGVMAASLVSVFGSAVRMRESTYERIENVQGEAAALALIRRDLVNMVSPGGILTGVMVGETEEDADVRLDSIEFVTSTGRLTDEEPWPDLVWVAYELQETETENAESYDLVRLIEKNLLAAEIEDPEEIPLVSGVKSLEITYFDGESWLDSWDSSLQENELPEAVRAQIDFLLPEEEDSDDDEPAESSVVLVPITVAPVPGGADSGSEAGQGQSMSAGGGQG